MAISRKQLITVLKILFSGVLLYFIALKIDLTAIGDIVKQTKWGYLVFGSVLFICSKLLAAFRLNCFFHQIKVPLTQKSNLKLYLLGMFYNLFLPGGIGGDAYKGYLIKKNYNTETKKVVSVLILDRLNGLLLLFIYACILFLFLPNTTLQPYHILAWIGLPSSVIVFYILIRKFFAYTLAVFWKTFGLSAAVQVLQLGAIWSILFALQIPIHTIAYLFIFLVSSIVAVLPLTLGGIGSREVTFFYGAQWLGLNENSSVSISLLFFMITALVSLFGAYYHFKKIILESTSVIPKA